MLDARRMADLFATVLGSDVPPDGDFFDLGGTSIVAARLIAGARDAFGVDLPLTAVFRHPTPRQLVEWLRGAGDRSGTADPSGHG